MCPRGNLIERRNPIDRELGVTTGRDRQQHVMFGQRDAQRRDGSLNWVPVRARDEAPLASFQRRG